MSWGSNILNKEGFLPKQEHAARSSPSVRRLMGWTPPDGINVPR
jgi:hypothetical protein